MKNKLRDERLQKVILEIDSAVNRERKLDEVMRNDPDFVEFVNEILYLMGVRELDEWDCTINFQPTSFFNTFIG